jgi:hypothetical protein
VPGRRAAKLMTRFILFPGDVVCSLVGLRGDSDHKQILRTFFNTLIWGAIGIVIVLNTVL